MLSYACVSLVEFSIDFAAVANFHMLLLCEERWGMEIHDVECVQKMSLHRCDAWFQVGICVCIFCVC